MRVVFIAAGFAIIAASVPSGARASNCHGIANTVFARAVVLANNQRYLESAILFEGYASMYEHCDLQDADGIGGVEALISASTLWHVAGSSSEARRSTAAARRLLWILQQKKGHDQYWAGWAKIASGEIQERLNGEFGIWDGSARPPEPRLARTIVGVAGQVEALSRDEEREGRDAAAAILREEAGALILRTATAPEQRLKGASLMVDSSKLWLRSGLVNEATRVLGDATRAMESVTTGNSSSTLLRAKDDLLRKIERLQQPLHSLAPSSAPSN